MGEGNVNINSAKIYQHNLIIIFSGAEGSCCADIFTWILRCNISCKMLWPCWQKYQTIYEWNSWDSLGAETQMEMFAFSFATSPSTRFRHSRVDEPKQIGESLQIVFVHTLSWRINYLLQRAFNESQLVFREFSTKVSFFSESFWRSCFQGGFGKLAFKELY